MTDFPTHSHTSTSETPTLSYTRSLIRYPIRMEPSRMGDYREYPREHSVRTNKAWLPRRCSRCSATLGNRDANLWRSKTWRLSLLYNPPIVTDSPPPPHKSTHPPNYDIGIYEVLHEVHTIKILFHHCNDKRIFVSDLRHATNGCPRNRTMN